MPSARTIARLITTARDHLSKAETVTIAVIKTGVPMPAEARRIIDDFHVMIFIAGRLRYRCQHSG